MPYRPTTELVAMTWLKGCPALASGVATDLPDLTTWPQILGGQGFVTIASVGGSRPPDLPRVDAVVSVDCWAAVASSSKLPWARANQMAEEIAGWLFLQTQSAVKVDLPASYTDALVLFALVLAEPRRIPDDAANYAHMTMDVQITWSSA